MKISRICDQLRGAGVMAALSAALISVPVISWADGFAVYLNAPETTGTIYGGALVETFNEYTPGIYSTPLVGPIGTYELDVSHSLAIQASDQYGNGTGNYAALGAESHSSNPITLQLIGEEKYFGFAWDAGDPENQLATTTQYFQLLPRRAAVLYLLAIRKARPQHRSRAPSPCSAASGPRWFLRHCADEMSFRKHRTTSLLRNPR